MYQDIKVIIKIGKETAKIKQTVGVRQGDNMSTVLFLFLMTALSESIDAEWDEAGLTKPKLH